MKALLSLLAPLVATSCATSPGGDDGHRAVSYECGQVVVVGWIATEESGLLDVNEDGIAWNSLSSAKIHVKRSLAGSRAGAVLPVSYASHAQLRGDTDFMFVLAPNPNNKSYGLISASLMDTQPHLAQSCTPSIKADADDAV